VRIPSSAKKIPSAYAWVYYGYDYTLFGDTTDEDGEILCRAVLAPWSQATLTWNNRPGVGEAIDGWEDVTEKGLYWCDVTELVGAGSRVSCRTPGSRSPRASRA
jgi:hypothetical protein